MSGEERVILGCGNNIGLDINSHGRIEASSCLFTIEIQA